MDEKVYKTVFNFGWTIVLIQFLLCPVVIYLILTMYQLNIKVKNLESKITQEQSTLNEINHNILLVDEHVLKH